MNETEQFISPEIVSLEKLQYAAQMTLPSAVAQSMKLDVAQEEMTHQLIFRLRAGIYAQRIADGSVTESREVVVETPATTWQMFKATHALSWWLGWLVRWRPVRMTQHRRAVTLTAVWTGYATFPDSSIVFQDDRLGPPVYQLMRSTDIRERSA